MAPSKVTSRPMAFVQGSAWSERIVNLALDCNLAEEGRNLSGGQREKVAIERLLVTRLPGSRSSFGQTCQKEALKQVFKVTLSATTVMRP
jgi:ABC-type thiamine transport system ATPase subunit